MKTTDIIRGMDRLRIEIGFLIIPGWLRYHALYGMQQSLRVAATGNKIDEIVTRGLSSKETTNAQND